MLLLCSQVVLSSKTRRCNQKLINTKTKGIKTLQTEEIPLTTEDASMITKFKTEYLRTAHNQKILFKT